MGTWTRWDVRVARFTKYAELRVIGLDDLVIRVEVSAALVRAGVSLGPMPSPDHPKDGRGREAFSGVNNDEGRSPWLTFTPALSLSEDRSCSIAVHLRGLTSASINAGAGAALVAGELIYFLHAKILRLDVIKVLTSAKGLRCINWPLSYAKILWLDFNFSWENTTFTMPFLKRQT